jgi:hypothetical protein
VYGQGTVLQQNSYPDWRIVLETGDLVNNIFTVSSLFFGCHFGVEILYLSWRYFITTKRWPFPAWDERPGCRMTNNAARTAETFVRANLDLAKAWTGVLHSMRRSRQGGNLPSAWLGVREAE